MLIVHTCCMTAVHSRMMSQETAFVVHGSQYRRPFGGRIGNHGGLMNRMLVGSALMAAAFVPLVGCSSYYTGKHEKALHANAVIAGPGITGEAELYEEYEGRVRIKLKINGMPDSKLTPGRHAIHIHETGNCE